MAFGGLVKDSLLLGAAIYITRKAKRSARKGKMRNPYKPSSASKSPMFASQEERERRLEDTEFHLWPPPSAWQKSDEV